MLSQMARVFGRPLLNGAFLEAHFDIGLKAPNQRIWLILSFKGSLKLRKTI